MKKRKIALLLSLSLTLTSCGGTADKPRDTTAETTTTVAETQTETTAPEPLTTETTENETISDLEALGKVDVDKNLFSVEVTIPAELAGDITQEELDENAKQVGFKAEINDDGSVTYHMTKEQHREMLAGLKEQFDTSLAEMIGSEDYPNITDIKYNSDYTEFTIVTTSTELNLLESFSILQFYMYGAMYNLFAGEAIDNIHVDFVNADTGEIISSSNSSDMGGE